MKPEDYDESEVNRQFSDALKRKNSHQGRKKTIGTIIALAEQGGYNNPLKMQSTAAVHKPSGQRFSLSGTQPVYYPHGMPARQFAGPRLGKASLFPLNAMSLFVALGGVGKTSAMIALAAHMAAGRQWGQDSLKSRKVMMLCVEETQDELNRKYGAAVHTWTVAERTQAQANLRLVSCLKFDPRLTAVAGRQIDGTGFSQEIVTEAKAFGAEVIILDHLQGFVSGDLNNSDTATALAREVNSIVDLTGAAVVVTAHISKANINATDVVDGFTTGSLAFENAARQVVGVIPLPDDVAKKYGIAAFQKDVFLLGMPKNSYGPPRETAFFQKVYVSDFHTVTVEPFEPPGAKPFLTAVERLRAAVVAHIKLHPGTTSNKLDALSGKKKQFGASKHEVRNAVAQLLAEGTLATVKLTTDDRKRLRLPHQAKEVYTHVE